MDVDWHLTVPSLQHIWPQILQHPKPQIGVKDSWYWTGHPSETFTFSSAWNLAGDHSSVFPCFNLVGYPHCSPMFSYCLLRALQRKLLTRQFLNELNIIKVDSYVLCTGNVETLDHLFFQCLFSSYLWSLFKLKLGLQPSVTSLSEEAAIIRLNIKKKEKSSYLAKTAFSATV